MYNKTVKSDVFNVVFRVSLIHLGKYFHINYIFDNFISGNTNGGFNIFYLLTKVHNRARLDVHESISRYDIDHDMVWEPVITMYPSLPLSRLYDISRIPIGCTEL